MNTSSLPSKLQDTTIDWWNDMQLKRVIEDARVHTWEREGQWTAEKLRRPGRELWILHPHGEAVPAPPAPMHSSCTSSEAVLPFSRMWLPPSAI